MNIQMELTNNCNLACWECPHRLMKRPKFYMYDSVFEVILRDYIGEMNPGTVILHKDGEPLLHPSIVPYMERISEVTPKAKIDLYTNGLLLDPKHVEFFTALPNKVWVLVSFHFYSHTGKLIDYTKVSDKLIQCMEIAEKAHNVEFVLASHVIDIADKKMLNDWHMAWDLLTESYHCLEAVHLNTAINPWGERIESEHCSTFTYCPYADGEHLFIGVTGNVLPCCIDLEEEIRFGNVLVDEREVILENRRVFYGELNKNIVEEELCRKCLNQGR